MLHHAVIRSATGISIYRLHFCMQQRCWYQWLFAFEWFVKWQLPQKCVPLYGFDMYIPVFVIWLQCTSLIASLAQQQINRSSCSGSSVKWCVVAVSKANSWGNCLNISKYFCVLYFIHNFWHLYNIPCSTYQSWCIPQGWGQSEHYQSWWWRYPARGQLHWLVFVDSNNMIMLLCLILMSTAVI